MTLNLDFSGSMIQRTILLLKTLDQKLVRVRSCIYWNGYNFWCGVIHLIIITGKKHWKWNTQIKSFNWCLDQLMLGVKNCPWGYRSCTVVWDGFSFYTQRVAGDAQSNVIFSCFPTTNNFSPQQQLIRALRLRPARTIQCLSQCLSLRRRFESGEYIQCASKTWHCWYLRPRKYYIFLSKGTRHTPFKFHQSRCKGHDAVHGNTNTQTKKTNRQTDVKH